MYIKEIDNFNNNNLFIEKSFQYGSIFNSVEWLNIYNEKLKVYGVFNNQDILIGFFNLYFDKKFGKKWIKIPPYSPNIAFYFENSSKNISNFNSENKKFINCLKDFLNQQNYGLLTIALPFNCVDTQPFIWDKYKVIPNYTYQIDLQATEDDILKAFQPERRNDIKKAIKDNVTIENVKSYEYVKQIVLKTFTRKEKNIDYQLIDKILFQFANENNSFAIVALVNNEPIASTFCIYDQNTAYYLLGGYDSNNKHKGAGALTLWEAIKTAKNKNLKVFDFEGSMIIPVEKYFRGFGGSIVPYYTINKASLPLEIILKFIKRETF